MPSAVPVPVVAEIVRSGFVEGHHYGSVVALAADGVGRLVGRATSSRPMLPRSCNKPIQALGDGPRSASTCRRTCSRWPAPRTPASRSTSRAYAASSPSAGLDESALQTPPDYPLDDDAREAVIRAGGAKAPILMNCSGKHAAMLATCVVNGWDTATYLEPDHPLQRRHPRRPSPS